MTKKERKQTVRKVYGWKEKREVKISRKPRLSGKGKQQTMKVKTWKKRIQRKRLAY